jgi:hypothetical protein
MLSWGKASTQRSTQLNALSKCQEYETTWIMFLFDIEFTILYNGKKASWFGKHHRKDTDMGLSVTFTHTYTTTTTKHEMSNKMQH